MTKEDPESAEPTGHVLIACVGGKHHDAGAARHSKKVRDFRITQFDPTLEGQFPDFADWAVVGVSHQYPQPRAGDEVLTIKHWTQKTYVHIRPPKAEKPGAPT